MKRIALILATVATTAFGPVALDLAHARDQDRGHSSQGRHGDRGGGWERQGRGGGERMRVPGRGGERGYPQQREYRGPDRRGYDEPRGRYEDPRGRYEDPRGRYVADPRRVPGRGNRYDDGKRRGRSEDPGPYGRGSPGYPAPYPRAPGVRPGGYLPRGYHDAPVEDYRRYRLRPPPRGYNWVRVGDGFALVSPDGQIFDMVR